MYKIAVLGSRDTVIGFKALGLDTFYIADASEAAEKFQSLTNSEDKYAIIYIEENFYPALKDSIDKYKDLPTPAIILIPGRGSTSELGQAALKAAVERAVGADIL